MERLQPAHPHPLSARLACPIIPARKIATGRGRRSAGPWPPQWRCSGWSQGLRRETLPSNLKIVTTTAAASSLSCRARVERRLLNEMRMGTRTSSSPQASSVTSAMYYDTANNGYPAGLPLRHGFRGRRQARLRHGSPSATRKGCASSATPSPPWTPRSRSGESP